MPFTGVQISVHILYANYGASVWHYIQELDLWDENMGHPDTINLYRTLFVLTSGQQQRGLECEK